MAFLWHTLFFAIVNLFTACSVLQVKIYPLILTRGFCRCVTGRKKYLDIIHR